MEIKVEGKTPKKPGKTPPHPLVLLGCLHGPELS
jgi:hypothetical protein